MSDVRAITKPSFAGGAVSLVASDGDAYSYTVPAPGAGSYLLEAGLAEQLARANAVWVPSPGSLEEYILSLQPLFYAPARPDLGSYDYSGYGASVTPTNGATLANGHVAGMHPGGYVLDGSNDYVATTAGTRRNLLPNPSVEVDTTNVNTNGAATRSRVTTQAKFGAASVEVVTPGTNNYDGVMFRTGGAGTLLPATNYGARVWVRMPSDFAGKRFNASFGFHSSTNAFLGLGTSTGGGTAVNATATGDWQELIIPVVTSPGVAGGTGAADTSYGQVTINAQTSLGAAVAATFYADAAIMELGAAGPFFDGTGYYDGSTFVTGTGRTGWLGTAHASASDLGIFANGTTRTFVLAMVADDQTTRRTYLGTGATGGQAFLAAYDGGKFLFWPNAGSAQIEAGASTAPANGEPHLAVIEFDEAANTAGFFRNGQQVGTTQTGKTAQYQSLSPLDFGKWNGGQNFDGTIGPVAVIPRALTAAEHAKLYDLARRRMW
jgi:hypothetical protein